MSRPDSFVTFHLDQQVYAIPLETIVRVTRAVEITTLPQSPPFLLGIIDVRGEVVPVLNLRRVLGHPDRAISVDDRILLADTGCRTLALVVDDVDHVGGSMEEERIVEAGQIAPALATIRGVFVREGRLVLVQNLGALLALDDQRTLDEHVPPGGKPS